MKIISLQCKLKKKYMTYLNKISKTNILKNVKMLESL